ncbi:MAG: polyprenyl synthetase family protein [Hadesarchaea archaeon]|nr:MAG: polyprenyl synthetase family protein [Hadesarchaea archaeon]HDI13105.1 polyprenyl synthetase family protein [Hadesarchaea archaeon]
MDDVDVLKYLGDRARLVEREIDRWVPTFEPEVLAKATRHLIDAGGKRLRPCLVITACEAVGGRTEDALETAAAIELLHNFTLIHDDIMDRDEFRRNVKTVHELWGEPMAIIAGDALFAKVFEAAAENVRRLNLDGNRITELFDTISKASFEICRGQAMDMMFERMENVSEGEYMEMVAKKTGALTEASTKVGALLGGGTPEQVKALGTYGLLMGTAFQIQDDVLGVTGDRKKFGKPIGSDIREGKRTLVVIRALSSASKKDKADILRALGKRNASEQEIEAAIHALSRTGAIDYVSEKARKLVVEAKKQLDSLPESNARDMLSALADFVIEREF